MTMQNISAQIVHPFLSSAKILKML